MRCKHKTTLLLTALLFVALAQAYAATHHLPSGKTVNIRNGLKVHFGNEWISTTGSDIHISSWFSNNWLNYTADNSGSQQIYNGSKPTTVLIDGSEKTEGDGWTYAAGVTSLSASSLVQMCWAGSTQPTIPPIIIPSGAITATWYLRSDTHTTLGVTGYKLAATETSTNQSDSRTAGGSSTVSYGIRAWTVHSDETTTELTGGTPSAVVTRGETGEGLQVTYWNCTGYSGMVDSIMVKVYQRFGSDSWSLRATFISQDELLVGLPEATWTVNYYTEKTGSTTSKLHWGDLAHNSSVTLYYTLPSIYDKMLYRLGSGDLVSFLVMPYTNYMGTMFYGFLLLIMGVTLYQRTESIVPVALMLMVFGGSAGIVTAMIPSAGLQLAWVFFVFGLAILLYKLVKGRT